MTFCVITLVPRRDPDWTKNEAPEEIATIMQELVKKYPMKIGKDIGLDAPYTGNSAPGQDSGKEYSCIGVEFFLPIGGKDNPPIKLADGASISLLTARKGAKADSKDTPAGDTPIQLAHFKNGKLYKNLTGADLQMRDNLPPIAGGSDRAKSASAASRRKALRRKKSALKK